MPAGSAAGEGRIRDRQGDPCPRSRKDPDTPDEDPPGRAENGVTRLPIPLRSPLWAAEFLHYFPSAARQELRSRRSPVAGRGSSEPRLTPLPREASGATAARGRDSAERAEGSQILIGRGVGQLRDELHEGQPVRDVQG